MIRNIKFIVISVLLSISSVWADADNAVVQTNQTVIASITSTAEDTLDVFVKTVTTPLFSGKDIQCLARNIFYEAGNQPEEGKVAVGLVTLNRAADPNYPSTICGVVNQRTIFTTPHTITKTHVVTEGVIFKKTKQVKETITTWSQSAVCQFSWSCMRVKAPKSDDPRWIESQRVAQALAYGEYSEWREKYANAMHFHAIALHPNWHLKKIAKVAGHVFYE